MKMEVLNDISVFLDKSKLKNRHKNPFFFRQGLKQKEKTSSSHAVFCIAELDKDGGRLKWIYIRKILNGE